jgi:hypothetical protein
MISFLYIVTLLSSIVGFLVLVFGFSGAKSAPQEAAAAAAALAIAVIPYVFTRCVQLTKDYHDRRATDKRILALLEEANSLAKRDR